MRILHLTLAYGIGGRSKAMRALLERLRALGVECDLCCLNQLTCATEEVDGLVGATDVLGRRSLVDGEALRRLSRLCQARRIQIIHAHDAASQFTAALLRLWHPGTKLLMTFHRTLGFESARLRDRVRNAFANLMSDAVVTGSRERREHFLRENLVSPRKVIRIPFGIDVQHFRPLPEVRAAVRQDLGLDPNTLVFGAIGHFGEEKGLDVVIKAFAALTRRRPGAPAALVILGDGPPARQELLQTLARECQPAQVIFAGFHPDVANWLQAFDLFLHAPRLEAFGLVLIEAMAAGLPVVATRVGGVPDIVRHGETGLLVPPDCPQALSDAVERLLPDRDRRQAMAARARQVAEDEFGTDLYAQRHLRLYQDLLGCRRPGGVDELLREQNGRTTSARPLPSAVPFPSGCRG